MIRGVWNLGRSLVSAFLIAGVRFYQIFLRPLLPPLCRFRPSCSEWMLRIC